MLRHYCYKAEENRDINVCIAFCIEYFVLIFCIKIVCLVSLKLDNVNVYHNHTVFMGVMRAHSHYSSKR